MRKANASSGIFSSAVCSGLGLSLFLFFFLCAELLTGDTLTVELCNRSNDHATNGIWFGTNRVPGSLFVSPAQYGRLTCAVDDPDSSWDIRIHTRNTNYTGPGPRAGLVNLADSTRKLPLFWRVFDSPWSSGLAATNSDGWGLMTDSADAGWPQSGSAWQLARSVAGGVLLAPYPVSNRVAALSNSLFVYFLADLGETLSRNMNGVYDATVIADLNRYLPSLLSLDSVSPDRGFSSDRKAGLTVIGRKFQNGAQVKLLRTGQDDISGDVTDFSTNRLVCRFDLTLCLVPGYYDLAVNNPGGGTAVLPQAFRVMGYDMTGNRLVPVNNFYLARPGHFVNVKWSIGQAGKVLLKIVNTAGETVKTIMDEAYSEAGSFQFDWDGTGDGGKRAASGIYFIMIKAGGFSDVKKIVVVR